MISFALIVSLISYNNANSSFSFEKYLDNISQVTAVQPTMPSTENITDTISEYDDTLGSSEGDIFKAIKCIWITLKVIYQCVVFALKFLVYIAEMLVYVLKIVSAMFYNLIVW